MDFTAISLPAWAISDESQAFLYGFVVAGMIRIFRAGLKWVRRVAESDRVGD